ncbi:DUF63 family protein [Methanotorris igneus]|uniref:DUF63 family protein n=1 Tax=Methanotorris igneus (strain DSM 5666 / JCM 11834 / Kol 5) TaxID=880724 RepID=F6BEU4_METIK|nr:DUF63 family protein [Methanotorris igneus]AEF95680.1 protein of unknown function DUF63 [Methanotorris igneus Kol 5]
MLSAIKEFIYEYYIKPMIEGSGYNLVQEITYGIFLTFMVYIFYKACVKLRVAIDEKFAQTTVFYVVLISLMRALVDAGVIERSFFTITPGIVILIGSYYMASILISGVLLRERYYKLAIPFALLPIIYFLPDFLNRIVHWEALLYVSLILFPTYILTVFIIKKTKIENKIISSKIDKYAIFSQLVDASATAVGIGIYGYWEQHPIPRFFMDMFGAYVMIPLKLAVVLIALYLINEEVDNKDLKNILKITIMCLGLAPGLRNLLRTIMGV